MDMRYATPFADTALCNVLPENGDLGLANARRIAPGAPQSSVLLERIQRLDSYRMPPLASSVVDDEAVTLITAWIESLTGCP